MISHVLVTRFNVRVPEWRKVDKSGQAVRADNWMAHRFGLFDQYTVPSVLAQTCHEFLWVVLFDIRTKEKWVEKAESYGCFQAYYVDNWLADLQQLLRLSPSEWLLTSRLDNDDAIAPKFIATVQSAAQERKEFLNIPNGYVIRRNKRNKPAQHTANPFISYVEPTKEAQSVYFTPHGRAMSKHAPIRQITTQRLWYQIIHERNYLNA